MNKFLLAVALFMGTAREKAAEFLPMKLGKESYRFMIEESRPGPAVTGKFQEGQPVSFRADGIDFFRQGEVLIYLDAGKWQRTRTGTLSDPLRILVPSAQIRAARLPHEELAQLEKLWINVKSQEQKTLTLKTGDLSEKAAKLLAHSESRPVVQSGKAHIWLDEKGGVAKYQIHLRLQGRLGGAEVDGETMKMVTISEVSTTRVEVPVEAKKALE